MSCTLELVLDSGLIFDGWGSISFRTLTSNDCSQLHRVAVSANVIRGGGKTKGQIVSCSLGSWMAKMQSVFLKARWQVQIKLIPVWFSSTDGSAIRTGFPSVVKKGRNESRPLCVVIINIDTESLKAQFTSFSWTNLLVGWFGGGAWDDWQPRWVDRDNGEWRGGYCIWNKRFCIYGL